MNAREREGRKMHRASLVDCNTHEKRHQAPAAGPTSDAPQGHHPACAFSTPTRTPSSNTMTLPSEASSSRGAANVRPAVASSVSPSTSAAIAAAAAAAIPAGPRRVSYCLPPRSTMGPELQFKLPSLDVSRKGRTNPLLIALEPSTPRGDDGAFMLGSSPSSSLGRGSTAARPTHPQHTLPVTSLALDMSTVISDPGSGSAAPRGILYTGARDGLLCSWELGLKLRRRKAESHRDASFEEEDEDEEATALLEDLDLRSDEGAGSFSSSDLPLEQQWEVDPDNIAGDVPPAKFRQCVQSHTDWINDMLLCNLNQTVVSAGSDGTVRMWNPHDAKSCVTPEVLGTHRDYVRALSHARDAGWVASGGFDSTVKLWDIKETRDEPIIQLAETAVRGSIYALSTNAAGTVIAAGTPEKAVRTFDPRSGKQIAQLVGHTDNIRSLIVSEDGRYLLSASSDCSIRLWSLAEQRCLHTFEHHSESVWSLHSSHPTLDVFYSGDRAGYVCKVDWERCAEPTEGECVVLLKDKGHPNGPPGGREATGIHKIVAQDNAYIWTAGGGSSVARWRDVPSRISREVLHPIGGTLLEPSSPVIGQHPVEPVEAPVTPTSRASAMKIASSVPASVSSVSFVEQGPSSLRQRGSTPQSVQSPLRFGSLQHTRNHSGSSEATTSAAPNDPAATLFGIPFDSLVCLSPANDPYGAPVGLGSISLRGSMHNLPSSASVASIAAAVPRRSSMAREQTPESSVPAHLAYLQSQRPKSTRSASIRFAPEASPHRDAWARGGEPDDGEDAALDEEESIDDAALDARRRYEDRELAVEAVPLFHKPEAMIQGTHGLIRTSMLNDRRHVLTVDTAGVVAVWDIIRGTCLGTFGREDVLQAAREAEAGKQHSQQAPRELSPAEALDVVRERIEGEASTPLWCTVDTRGGLLAVRLEELRAFDAEIYIDELDFIEPFPAKEDQRANIGRLVLRNLFDGFIAAEQKLRLGPKNGLAPGTLALERLDLLQTLSMRISLPSARGFDRADSQHTPGLTLALAEPAKKPALLPDGASPLTPSASHGGVAALSTSFAALATATPSASNRGDYFSLPSADVSTPDSGANTPSAKGPGSSLEPMSPGGGLMSRLRLGRGNKSAKADKSADTPEKSDKAEKVVLDPAEVKLQPLRQLLEKPITPQPANECPTYVFPPNTSVLVEAAPEAGHWETIYRGLVRTAAADVAALETAAPLWLLDFLLGNRVTQKEVSKLSFTLTPWVAPGSAGKPDGFGGFGIDKSDASSASSSAPAPPTPQQQSISAMPLPELPTGNARLTATRMLRIRKSCFYVAEKLELAPPHGSRTHSIAGSRRPSADAGVTHSPSALSMTALAQSAASARTAQTHSRAASIRSGAGEDYAPGQHPTELVEILCNEHVLPLDVTLAQVQRYYWRAGGDVELKYRRRTESAL